MTVQFILAAVVALQSPTTPVAGSIRGVVVNASRDQSPVGGAEVVLRVKLDGQFVIAAEVKADEQGRFAFDDIPAAAEYIYLPGANRGGVHYPGSRLRLGAETPHKRVRLAVRDPISEPNPLVLRRQEISLYPETDALRVTETLLIENPSSQTYVGRPDRAGGRAATLRLSIPSDFRRTTFHEEFYGRQFTLIDGQLVTDIPWTPGRRELTFTYVLPNTDRRRVWQRPLDLPCDHLRIKVYSENPQEISCNLAQAASQTQGAVTFESTSETLPADQIIRLELGRLPLSLGNYARWLALAILVMLIATAGLIGSRDRWRPTKAPEGRSADALRKAA